MLNNTCHHGNQIKHVTNVTYNNGAMKLYGCTVHNDPPAAEPIFGPPAPAPFVPRWKQNPQRRVR